MTTLLMVKPDIVEEALYGEIIAHVLRNRFKIVDLKMLEFDRETAERFYDVHREREFFPELVDYITSGPVVALRIEGDGAVERIRRSIFLRCPKAAVAISIARSAWSGAG